MSSTFTPLCENCTKGHVLPGEPIGSMNADGSYHSPSPSGANKRAIVLLTDIFGLALKNPKILADRFAERLSCDVWVPDQFHPYPAPLREEDLAPFSTDTPNQAQPFWHKVRWALNTIPAIPSLLTKHRAVNVVPKIENFINKLKTTYGYEKIGVVGYCFGGMIGVHLSGIQGLISSAVICHPGPLKIEELEAAKVPTSFVCSEEDTIFPPKLKAATQEFWSRRTDGVEYELVTYPGTVRGFAARPALFIPEVKEGFEKAFEQTVNWFEKTVTR